MLDGLEVTIVKTNTAPPSVALTPFGAFAGAAIGLLIGALAIDAGTLWLIVRRN